jgi:hypothetical protein
MYVRREMTKKPSQKQGKEKSVKSKKERKLQAHVMNSETNSFDRK